MQNSAPKRKPYGDLTDEEKWVWHAYDYAFRRVILGTPAGVTNSPCDPLGEWFDADAIAVVEDRLRRKHRRPVVFKFTDQEVDERAAWAKLRGFACWNDFLDAVMVGRESVMPFLAWSAAKREVVAAPAVQGFVGLAAALGASAVPAALEARTAPEVFSGYPDTKIPEHPPGRSADAPADAVPEFCV